METRKCVQCGKDFTLTDSEISFYKAKGLNLPKRCANCRKENNRKSNNNNAPKKVPGVKVYSEESYKPSFVEKHLKGIPFKVVIPIVLIAIVCVAIFSTLTSFSGPDTSSTDNTTKSVEYYYFRNQEYLIEHYSKHGSETGCSSADEYLRKANAVIDNEKALTKYEAEDGDKIYFIESTGEIVFVSTDGVIRTYFIADKAYFERT